MKKLLIGGHISIAEGIEKSLEKAESIGCTAMQIFTKSNRQWYAKEIDEETIKKFKKTQSSSNIKSIVTHASYLINIGSNDPIINKKSVESLTIELNRCEQLSIPYLILHPGNFQKSSEKDCLNLIAYNLNKIFAENKTNTLILLENMAGMGTSAAYKFEQLAYIYQQIKSKDRIGICFDTCHAFAAGYDFRTKNNYENMWKEFDQILGLNLLKAMHLNDSKKDCGSKVDRHEFIGKGKIGLEAFKLIINDERFFNVPKILETPIDKVEDYKSDLHVLINLISTKNQNLITNTPLIHYLNKK